MFKKPLKSLKTSAPLRSSDRRKLKQRVISSFNVTDEDGELLVPEGIMSIKFVTHLDDPGVAYLAANGDPLWFTTGKGSDVLIPTVHTLWKKFDLLPVFSTPPSVIPILVGGADLMIPGVVECPQPLAEKQLVAVVEYHSTASEARHVPRLQMPPLAVGKVAQDVVRGEASGKAVYVLHTWKDSLWETGSKGDPPSPRGISKAGEDTGIGSEADGDKQQRQGSDLERSCEVGDNQKHTLDSEILADGPDVAAIGNLVPQVESLVIDETPESSSLSKEDVSEILRASLLQAIATSLSKLSPSSFPISATNFYSSYILPARPTSINHGQANLGSRAESSWDGGRAGGSSNMSAKENVTVGAEIHDGGPSNAVLPTSTPVDIKHSSYKSLTAFLKACEKEGLIKVKEIQRDLNVTAIFPNHPHVQAHQPYTSLKDADETREKREQREKEKEERSKPQLTVLELWKPAPDVGVTRLWNDSGKESSRLYSLPEITSVINSYIASKNLINERDRAYVNVLSDEILPQILSSSVESVEFIRRDQLVKAVVNKMTPWHKIFREGEDENGCTARKGPVKSIHILLKKRRAKFCTYITNFEPFFIDADALAEDLKTTCASSTSVTAIPGGGKSSGQEVMVQGKQIPVVTAYLLSKGVPKKWIEASEA